MIYFQRKVMLENNSYLRVINYNHPNKAKKLWLYLL